MSYSVDKKVLFHFGFRMFDFGFVGLEPELTEFMN